VKSSRLPLLPGRLPAPEKRVCKKMKQTREKIVGIIGGMGPEATVDLMQRIIRLTPATDDMDHIRCIVDNNPKVPSRIKAIIEGDGQDPGPVMADMAGRISPDLLLQYARVCDHVKEQTVRVAIVACTELSALGGDLPFETIDASQVLAQEIVRVVKHP
jgi:aspartate/glutamate racemase